MRGQAVALLLALLAPLACALPEAVRSPFGGELSIDKEVELTANIHRQIRNQAAFVTDPALLAYVNELGQRIVGVTEPQPFIYRFSILEGAELNAFTIGGGYVYISSGVLAQAGDLAELTGVLAHEIAHVRQRHIAKARENQGLATLVSLAATAAVIFAGGDPGILAISEGINVSMQLKHSRAAEAEADHEGIGYMVRAGYDPTGMIHFFERILTTQPGQTSRVPAYLFSHPALEERIAAAGVTIGRMELPVGLDREDRRLEVMQGRLALVLGTVAGGTGVQARAHFEREPGDRVLEQARAALAEGELAHSDAILGAGELRSPADPRLPLMRADLAEREERLDAARVHLERAFELDPSVPLVQYRLGTVHRHLGNRSQAVFYLEQAATNFRAESSSRRRAELEIERLSFPPLDASGLGTSFRHHGGDTFIQGDAIVWWGQLSRRFQSYNPELRARWKNPADQVIQDDSLRMSPRGRVSSTLETRSATPGAWEVEIRLGDSFLERHRFELGARAERPAPSD